MKVKSIAWVGCPAGDLKESRRFFENDLELDVFHASEDDQVAMFELPSGQFFEVMGEASPWHKYLKHPVIAFEVDDVPSARAELEAKGVKFVSENASDGGFVWAFFQGPDGLLYEIMSKPDQG